MIDGGAYEILKWLAVSVVAFLSSVLSGVAGFEGA